MTDPIREALETAAEALERVAFRCTNVHTMAANQAANAAAIARAALAAEQGPAVPDEVRESFAELERRQENLHRFRDLRTALAPEPPAPDPHKALAARPLLEAVARMADRIGQHTVGEIAVISDRAAAWLAENPPGQPVAIEPRGCPTPGACSCVEPPAPATAADHLRDGTEMVGDGEREELAADLDECADSCVLAEKHNWAKHMRRAAALLRELEAIAFAASDYLCAKKFPTFASEHGGLDRLEANLSRLVAHFEHGPQPVPGVDVPGPDGDYGGIQEICNAEGVDVRIGAPLLRRALAAWKQTQPPQGGEVAE